MLGLIGLFISAMSNLLNASAVIFFEPCIYMSSGLYSSRISLHLMTLSVLNVLKIKFLWSVYTLICYPNSFRVSTIESNLHSLVV